MIDPNEARQVKREYMARQAALGRRVDAMRDGHLGPVLKRWVNAGTLDAADFLRDVASAYVAGDLARCAAMLDTPLFGQTVWGEDHSLQPLMLWCLRGQSLGRAGGDATTYADDLALTALGIAISKIAQTKHTSDGNAAQGYTLNAVMDSVADGLRETVTGQFLVSIQGAEAMARVRGKYTEGWQQNRSLKRIVGMLKAKVRPELLRQEDAYPDLVLDGKRVLTVQQSNGDRRIELKRTPDDIDWMVLLLAWEEEKARHRPLWLALAMMILCCAQKANGWFDLTTRAQHDPLTSQVKDRGSKRYRGKTKVLVLSEAAAAAVAKDVEQWVTAGFFLEPMVVPPVNGDYLTVKHRSVGGRRGPQGLNTEVHPQTTPRTALSVLAESPWQVNVPMLQWCREHPDLVEHCVGAKMGKLPLDLTLGAFRRDAYEQALYLPTSIDFRGRMYYRPNWINPQTGSLPKALLRFQDNGKRIQGLDGPLFDYLADLLGSDTASAREWIVQGCPFVERADEPLILHAAGQLIRNGQEDSVPVQLDGTCNGLQHLCALARDRIGGRKVNLTADTAGKQDVYAEVAATLTVRFERLCGPFPLLNDRAEGWLRRFAHSGVQFTRKLCKRPVMVLPFGGTQQAIIETLKASLIEQLDAGGDRRDTPWHGSGEDGMAVYDNRPLANHPLFNLDCRKLGDLLWACIAEAIPGPMATMKAFRAIGSMVGKRGLQWVTPSGLVVMQAKSMADRKQVKMRGFHLPNSVRRLTLLADRNEIDPRYHTMGIVANFIHSMDAAHLSNVLGDWSMGDETHNEPIGAIHDCVLVRPSMVAHLGHTLRGNFEAMYRRDPLEGCLGMVDGATKVMEVFSSWYVAAEAAGIPFPEFGSWRPEEVMASKWFFS